MGRQPKQLELYLEGNFQEGRSLNVVVLDG